MVFAIDRVKCFNSLKRQIIVIYFEHEFTRDGLRLARIKILGTEKCTHVNKKTGLQDCNKLGRINPKPVISWNNKLKFDKNKKRQYVEFIHNDGTSHILGRFDDYRLSQMKGHPLEDLFKGVIILANANHAIANAFNKIAEASLKWNLTKMEERFLVDAMREGNLEPLITKYKQKEHERRRLIYDHSQDLKKEGYRIYGSVEFEEVDKTARNLLSLSREDFKLQLSKLTEDEFIKVEQRLNELINGIEKWLYDRKELFEQVAREKGYKLPEPKRKLSTRTN